MRAREVHAILNRELGPAMRGLGFERTGSATASWRQPTDPDGIDPRYFFVSTHVGHSGFSDHSGGWFTIELWVGASPNVAGPPISRPATYFDFLSPTDKQLLLELANQARAVIPHFRNRPPEDTFSTDGLPYYSAEHVAAYAQVLRDLLPHIITVFALTRQFPPPSEVTDAL